MKKKTWYALYTKSRHERKVTDELEKKGITAYLPLIRTLRQWSDRKKKVEIPLISSYVFVNVNNKEYYDVLSIYGAVCYVTFEGKAAPIRASQIEVLKKAVDGNMSVERVDKCLKKGQKVKIISGPLKGCTGEYVKTKKKSNFVINMDNVGLIFKVEINADDVIKI